jgi:hypothetical protein
MKLSSRRWRVWHLVLSWFVYWICLAIITVGPGLMAANIVANGPKNSGNVSVGAGSAGLTMTVTEGGTVVWDRNASLFMLTLLFAGPPLGLWVLWLRRSDRGATQADEPGVPDDGQPDNAPPSELPAPMPDTISKRDRVRRTTE